MLLSALRADRVANLGLLLVAGLIVVAVVAAVLARAVVAKVVAAAVLILVCFVVWSQRASLQDCAARAQALTTGDPRQCSFFGVKVDVSVP
jgi:hypothetical protein